MSIIICELFGTMLLVLLGDSVCMNINLNKSGNKGGGPLMCCIGWGFAVMVPAFIFGKATGSHFNPAITIALAVRGVANGGISWDVVPLYLVGEMLGGFIGAVLCTIMYYNHLEATPDPDLKRGCYCTGPSIRNTGLNLYSEIVDSFILMCAILGIGQTVAGNTALNYVFLWGIITSIGTAFGGVTGFAMNPARDLGPRIVYALLCPGEDKNPDWGYAWIPVVGPICGTVLAALVYTVLPLPPINTIHHLF